MAQGGGQRRPGRGVVHGRPVGLAEHRAGGGAPVGRGRGGQQHRARRRRPGREARPAPQRSTASSTGTASTTSGWTAIAAPVSQADPAGPVPGQGQHAEQQQPHRHRVLGMPPAHRDAPDPYRARPGQQRPPGPGHAQVLGDRVGGEQGHGRQAISYGPASSHRPGGGCARLAAQREPRRVGDRDHRDQDHRRARAARSARWAGCTGRPGRRAAAAGPRPGPPQVVRQRPAASCRPGPGPTRWWRHPDDQEPGRGEEREQPSGQPRPGGGGLVAGHGSSALRRNRTIVSRPSRAARPVTGPNRARTVSRPGAAAARRPGPSAARARSGGCRRWRAGRTGSAPRRMLAVNPAKSASLAVSRPDPRAASRRLRVAVYEQHPDQPHWLAAPARPPRSARRRRRGSAG